MLGRSAGVAHLTLAPARESDPPRAMGCRDFDPSLEKFCSDPRDFVNAAQIVQMATFFGIKGRS